MTQAPQGRLRTAMKKNLKILVLALATVGLHTLSRAMPLMDSSSESDELYSESIYNPKTEVEVPHSLESSARTPISNEEFDALNLLNETVIPESD
jgi:hypothetical protein